MDSFMSRVPPDQRAAAQYQLSARNSARVFLQVCYFYSLLCVADICLIAYANYCGEYLSILSSILICFGIQLKNKWLQLRPNWVLQSDVTLRLF